MEHTAEANRHISSSRAPIPDVPAIYLVEPNPENLQAITNDLQKGLYGSANINFLSSIPRPLLEDFAAQAATAGTSELISQVFDQYLNFIVTEPDLFSLGMQKEHTYWALNSAKTKDEELDRVVDRIVSGLFSVVVTMGMLSSPFPAGAFDILSLHLLRRNTRCKLSHGHLRWICTCFMLHCVV